MNVKMGQQVVKLRQIVSTQKEHLFASANKVDLSLHHEVKI